MTGGCAIRTAAMRMGAMIISERAFSVFMAVAAGAHSARLSCKWMGIATGATAENKSRRSLMYLSLRHRK